MINENTLVYDCETQTFGKPDPSKDRLRLFGCYSYKTKKIYVLKNKSDIQKAIDAHKYLVGFNNVGSKLEPGYDNPILQREGIKFYNKTIIDLKNIFKERASQMKIKKGMLGDLLMEYSLDYITKTLDLVNEENSKMKIDYKLFEKTTWTNDEYKLVIDYTKRDIEVTKRLYEWTENFFEGFKPFITQEDIDNKVYLTASIARFAYKAICVALKWKEEYDTEGDSGERIGGGYVSYPAGERFEGNIFVLDFQSLYPSIMIQCNLHGRKKEGELNDRPVWTGGGKWKTDGAYYSDELNGVAQLFKKWFKERIEQKAKGNRIEYTYKILLNASYGILNNAYYKLVFDRVAGGDCTRLGRQFIKYARKYFNDKGYQVAYSDSVGKNSIIRTNKGKIQIEDLFNMGLIKKDNIKEYSFINDIKTLTINKKNKIIYDTIIKVIRHKTKKKIYKIHFNCYEYLIVTEDHSLMWFDRDGKLKEQKPNDSKYVIGLKNIPYISRKDKSLSQEFLEFLGYLVANGNVSKIKNETNNRFYFAISTGKDTKEFIQKVLNKLGWKYYVHNNNYDITINDEKAKMWLKNNGFEGTSKTKKIPIFIFNLSEEQIGAFLRGYFSGDGSVSKGRPGCGSVNEQLILQIRDLLLQLGITTTMKRDFKPNHYKGIYPKELTYNFWLSIIDVEIFRTKIGFIFDRKNKKIGNIGKKYYITNDITQKFKIGLKTGVINQKSIEKFNVQNFIDVPIKRILKIEEINYNDYVYDIQTQKTHMFFANDILVHNTDSIYIVDKFNDKAKMLEIKQEIIDSIKSTLPFPAEMFDMNLEAEVKYLFFFKGQNKEDKDTDSEMDEFDFCAKPLGMIKKNYAFVKTNGEVVIKNLGIRKKSNSMLSRKIFEDYLIPQIKNGQIKFSKTFLRNTIMELLQKDITLAAMRKEVGNFDQYVKSQTSLPAQIAQKYGSGTHFMIPNLKGIGVGKGKSFCTVDEFKAHGMKVTDIDLDNVYSELDYFTIAPRKVNIFEFDGK